MTRNFNERNVKYAIVQYCLTYVLSYCDDSFNTRICNLVENR